MTTVKFKHLDSEKDYTIAFSGMGSSSESLRIAAILLARMSSQDQDKFLLSIDARRLPKEEEVVDHTPICIIDENFTNIFDISNQKDVLDLCLPTLSISPSYEMDKYCLKAEVAPTKGKKSEFIQNKMKKNLGKWQK